MLKYFICHASEDKQRAAQPIADELSARGLQVWYDEYVLNLGDSLRQSIDKGLSECDLAIVILSPSFFKKHWPQRELDGLTMRETQDRTKIVLPVWHKISIDEVSKYSFPLSDRLAINTNEGVVRVCNAIVAASECHLKVARKRKEIEIKLNDLKDTLNRLRDQHTWHVYMAGADDGFDVHPSYEGEIASFDNQMKRCRERIRELEDNLSFTKKYRRHY